MDKLNIKNMIQEAVTSSIIPKKFKVLRRFRVGDVTFNVGNYKFKKKMMGKSLYLNKDNGETLAIDLQDYIAAVGNKLIKEYIVPGAIGFHGLGKGFCK